MHHRFEVKAKNSHDVDHFANLHRRLAVLQFSEEPVRHICKLRDFELSQPELFALGTHKSPDSFDIHERLLSAADPPRFGAIAPNI